MRYLTLLTVLVSLTFSAYAQQDWIISFHMEGPQDLYTVVYTDNSGQRHGELRFDNNGKLDYCNILTDKLYNYFSKYLADDGEFCSSASWYCMKNGDNASAVKWLERKFELLGRNKVEIANELNNYIYFQGLLNRDFQNAAHAFIDKALATPGLSKSDKAMFWDTKGEIYAAQGNKVKANECYRKVLANNPNHYKDGPTALSTYISTGRYPN